MKIWQKWKFKNLTFFIISIFVAFFIAQSDEFYSFLHHIGQFEYLGAFVGGMLYVSTFTVATGAVILIFLSDTMPLWQLTLVASLGSIFGDFVIFKFVKDKLSVELELIYDQIDEKHHIAKLIHTKYFSWTLPVIGSAIIASPFPDELGVSLLGISKISTLRFMILTSFLDFVGIFALVAAAKALVG